jgi:hypothetical protein
LTADIAFVYGSRWKQRYFSKIGDDYFPQPAQWDTRLGLNVGRRTTHWVPDGGAALRLLIDVPIMAQVRNPLPISCEC